MNQGYKGLKQGDDVASNEHAKHLLFYTGSMTHTLYGAHALILRGRSISTGFPLGFQSSPVGEIPTFLRLFYNNREEKL